MIYLEGAELNIYTIDGQSFTVDLSSTQLEVIGKILGFSFNASGTLNMHSDEGLKALMEYEGNPFKLKQLGGQENE